MVLDSPRTPLRAAELDRPEPGPGEVLIQVTACGVCRTDLHVVDGELTDPKLPLVPGHQIVATVAAAGGGAGRFVPGARGGEGGGRAAPGAGGWGFLAPGDPGAPAATAARAGRTSATTPVSPATSAKA